jgi:ParB family chromosome partitioning protein
MTDTVSVTTAAPRAITAINAQLADFGPAPENVRFAEPADDGIGQLADTILAAGVAPLLIVRLGRKGNAS